MRRRPFPLAISFTALLVAGGVAFESGAAEVEPPKPSGWSNRGAQVPIVAPAPETSPRSEDALSAETPPAQVETSKSERREASTADVSDVLSARLYLGAYHLETRGQDQVYDGAQLVAGADRDIDLLRGRATIRYQRVARTRLGLHLDLAYRPSLNGPRPGDHRVTELFASYGRDGGVENRDAAWGVAVGRVVVREAGSAQADGLAGRLLVAPGLELGLFGGFTVNPYGYDWAQGATSIVSSEWITGGGFVALEGSRYRAQLAGVVTYANIDASRTGVDRIFAFVDAAYRPSRDLDLALSGWLDILPSGELVQDLEASAQYEWGDRAVVTAGLGRFSTVVYEVSSAYTFATDPDGNVYDPQDPAVRGLPIVGEDGAPILPYDAALLLAVYNQARLRAGYRLLPDLEVYSENTLRLRDGSSASEQSVAAVGRDVPLASLRFLPALGARYRNPQWVDARGRVTLVFDDQSQADAMLAASVGRGFLGFYLELGARLILGAVTAVDGGVDLSYRVPMDLTWGRTTFRAAFRYFREDVALERPVGTAQAQVGPNEARALIPLQESYLGFLSFEWRL